MPKLSNECCKAQKLFLDYLQTCIYFIEEPFNSIGTVFGHSKVTVTFIFSAIYLLKRTRATVVRPFSVRTYLPSVVSFQINGSSQVILQLAILGFTR